MTQQAERIGVNDDRTALPLVEAANRLGMSSDAVRMRWKRGKIPGFRHENRVFIYVAEQVNGNLNKAKQETQQTPEQGEQTSAGHHDDIVELQKAELTRLLQDNERLNSRIDSLIEMQQREQILRQQMQGQLDQLMERLALPSPPQPPAPEVELKERLQATETKFNVLSRAVGQLVAFLERRRQ